METTYCDNCGLLHDPDDGECLGCKMSKEIKELKAKEPCFFTHELLKKENEKLKDAIKAELKRTGGCVPILNAVLKDCEAYGGEYSQRKED